jgi:hypothetical protein
MSQYFAIPSSILETKCDFLTTVPSIDFFAIKLFKKHGLNFTIGLRWP